MTLLGSDTITVQRRSEGSWNDDGEYVEGTVETFEADANVQPMGGRQAQTLPEGLRQRVGKVIYTNADLQAVDQDDNVPGDRIEYGGELWEVRKVEAHNGLLTHTKATVVRTKE